eukprot:gene20816-26984_t
MSNKLIYDVWPPPGAVLHEHAGYNHDFYDNYGAGKLLNDTVGLFQTWQFALYKVIMGRLRVSEYRTRDPLQATAFIIPFDAGVHSYIDHKTGFPRLASPHGWAAGDYLRSASRNKKLYWKNNGHDHFALFSITAFQMVGIGVKVFFMQICQNCSVITIETSPTFTAIKGRSRKYWFGAPYPSSYHWYEGIKELPWELNNNYPNRDILALFIGSLKTSQPNSNNLRKKLYNQCIVEKSNCQWHTTAHSCNGVVNATNTMLLFRRAQYCPAPTGDSITRKSIFDSLVAGCVPVLFSRASLSQYSWHISPKDLDEVSVYIPMKDINDNGINFIDVLNAIPKLELIKKQQAIAKLAPTLQYSVVPKRIGNGSDCQTWRPPFRDAVDIIIEKILDPKTVEPIDGFSDVELLHQHEKQNDIMDNHEDYAALRSSSTSSSDGESKKKKKQEAKGMSTISKILYTDTDPNAPDSIGIGS